MTDDKLAANRHKNAAYHALCNARCLCDRRRHTAGTVPAAWLGKLGELERAYTVATMIARTRGGVQ